jgi:hypothetical protein
MNDPRLCEVFMPQYFFDVRSIDWDYTDPDGIALPDDEAAIVYAERMIGELKEDGGYDAPDLQMLAKNDAGQTIFSISFNSRNDRNWQKVAVLLVMKPETPNSKPRMN